MPRTLFCYSNFLSSGSTSCLRIVQTKTILFLKSMSDPTLSEIISKIKWLESELPLNPWGRVKGFKDSSDPSHLFFLNQCRKESDPTYNDSEIE